MSAPATPAAAVPANPERGEASVRVAGAPLALRPSFAALVAAEAEVGPLFGLVDRAAQGKVTLGEMAALFWRCRRDAPPALTREQLGDAIVDAGLTAATPVLKTLLHQVLAGR